MPPGPPTTVPRLEAEALVARDGTRLALHRWGPRGPARAIVLGLHSFGDYGGAFAALGQHLADAGIATLAIDQRGFGASPQKGRWPGPEALRLDLLDLLRALPEEPTPVFLLGESMGGSAALAAAAQSPLPRVAALILVAPGVREGLRLRYLYNVGLWAAATLVPGYTAEVDPADPRLTDGANGRLSQTDPIVREVRADTYYGLIRFADRASDNAGGVQQPVLVLYGTADGFVRPVSICALAQRLPQRPDGIVYEGGVHRLLHQKAFEADIQEAILDWIDRRPIAPTGSGQQRLSSFCAEQS